MSAVYIWTKEAPARIFSKASWPVQTPPTPMIGTRPKRRKEGSIYRKGIWCHCLSCLFFISLPWVREYMSLTIWVESCRKGAPLSPPTSLQEAPRRVSGRLTVVLVTTSPSMPSWKRRPKEELDGSQFLPILGAKMQLTSSMQIKQSRGCLSQDLMKGMTACPCPSAQYLTHNPGNVPFLLACQVWCNLHQHSWFVLTWEGIPFSKNLPETKMILKLQASATSSVGRTVPAHREVHNKVRCSWEGEEEELYSK